MRGLQPTLVPVDVPAAPGGPWAVRSTHPWSTNPRSPVEGLSASLARMPAPGPVPSTGLVSAPLPPRGRFGQAAPRHAGADSSVNTSAADQGGQQLVGAAAAGGVEHPNPIADLQDRVARKLGRPVAKGDIVYTCDVRAVPNSAPAAVGGANSRGVAAPAAVPCSGFVARVQISGIGLIGTGVYTGSLRLSKQEAKRSASEAALLNQELAAALPARSAGAVLRVVREGPAAPDERGPATNPVTELQEMIHHAMRTTKGKDGQVAARQEKSVEDIVYNFSETMEGAFIATVDLTSPGGSRATFSGMPKSNKREAKRSAAEAVLRDPAQLHALLQAKGTMVSGAGPAGKAALKAQKIPPTEQPGMAGALALQDSTGARWNGGVVAGGGGNPVGKLQERLMNLTRRPVKRGDVEYIISMGSDVGGCVARVVVHVVDGKPSCVGPACTSKREAKSAAAQMMLNDPAFVAAQPAVKPIVSSGVTPQTGNSVSELQAHVQQVLRRLSTKDDIVYTFETLADGSFVAQVLIKAIKNSMPRKGTPSLNKIGAKRSAAAVALAKLKY